MKKIIDSVYIRCISHATEDLDKVKDALEFLTLRKDFKVTETRGYHGNEILILELEIKNRKEIENLWRHLAELGVVDELIPILDEIVDDHGNLYLRFDKQEAYLGRVAISSKGDTIAMRTKILSYPRKKSEAIKNFREFIRSIQS